MAEHYVKQDEAFKRFQSLFKAGEISPSLYFFVHALDSGDTCIRWQYLRELGFCQSDGSFFRLMGSYRDYENQVTEYKRGRVVQLTKETDAKGYRYKIISSSVVNPAAKSTNAFGGASYHNYGAAVDLCLRTLGDGFARDTPVTVGGKQIASNITAFYRDIGLLECASRHGIEWGGSWSDLWDMVHFQDKFLSLPSGDIWDYMCHWSYVAPKPKTGFFPLILLGGLFYFLRDKKSGSGRGV